jgi:hypothetical protein
MQHLHLHLSDLNLIPVPSRFLGNREPPEIPPSAGDRLKLMKSPAAEWVEPMRSIVLEILDGTDFKSIGLGD